ncbi:MAG: RluA family pseudouridine synthase [Acidobacteria bacterium]|nr:RluA family pseudouridine synthase [Acidobacteriota bacterium]
MLLFQSDDVLAVGKPPGVSMATSSRPGSGEAAVARLLAACGLPPEEGLGLVHRLDEPTSGVVLLSRNAAAHRTLTLAFQERQVTKTYRALVWGHPVPAAGVVDAPLGRDPVDGRRMKVVPGGKPSVTGYRTLRRFPSVADLSLAPETGRTHQIRVHLAYRGHPLVGDDLYGTAKRTRGVRDPALRAALEGATRCLLHAERVVVPALGVDVTAPLWPDHEALLGFLARMHRG